MRQNQSILKVMTIVSAFAFAGALGCNSGTSGDTNESTEAAVKAASPACTSARDACKTQAETIASGIEAACKPAEAACSDHDGGAAASPACTAAHAACKAAIAAAVPQLKALGMSCESAIQMACVVDHGDAGARRDDDHDGRAGHGGFDGGLAGRGGLFEHGESAACEAAENACRGELESLRATPPAACTSIEMACMGQTPASVTDACKAAVSSCRDALTMAAGTVCGADIAAACAGHGG
jgi:hypothetical protein